MALYRQIGGIGQTQRMPGGAPVVWNDTIYPDHVFTAIGDCLRSGYLTASGIGRRYFNNPAEAAAGKIVNQYFRTGRAAVAGFFDGLLHGIAAVSMALPRNAFLGMVALNAFGYATKLQKALQIQESKDKMSSIWEKLGGKFSALEDTINSGAKKRALLKISNGKFVSGASVGIVPVVAAALIAAATSVIAALMPVISKILDKNKVNVTYPGIDPTTGLPVDGSAGAAAPGIMDTLRSPVVIAAALALGIYYFMD